MAINHEMNYYNYGKTLSAEGIMMPLPTNGNKGKHEYVDLGLPSGLKWATCNIGALSPEENGLYFAWGETSGYTAEQVGVDKNFTWDDYSMTSDGGETFDKYNDDDGLRTLEPEDDAATVNWGEDWRMPTTDEFEELLENTTSSWTEVNGVSGMLLTSNVEGHEEETLFFPAVGNADDGQVYGIGIDGDYLSASLGHKGVSNANRLSFHSGQCEVHVNDRYYGYAVRPVCSQNI